MDEGDMSCVAALKTVALGSENEIDTVEDAGQDDDIRHAAKHMGLDNIAHETVHRHTIAGENVEAIGVRTPRFYVVWRAMIDKMGIKYVNILQDTRPELGTPRNRLHI